MWQLFIGEREKIMTGLARWLSQRAIARLLWRSVSTICRELQRNTWRWEYSANKAQHKYYVRKLYAKKNLKKIRCEDKLEEYIREKIKDDRSPELIAWRWNRLKNGITISTPTIYKYVYSRFGYELLEHLYTRRNNRKRRQWHKNKQWGIKYRTLIDVRPEGIGKLWESGHYEADLIVWPQWTKEVLLVLIEKISRRRRAAKLPNKKATTVENVIRKRVIDRWIKSITFDNGLEFANHHKLGIPTYFSNPYCSREKGQIERCNRDYRRFFPKKTKRKTISQEEIDIITDKYNNMPMKVLGFKTPNEVFYSHFKKIFSSVAFHPLM